MPAQVCDSTAAGNGPSPKGLKSAGTREGGRAKSSGVVGNFPVCDHAAHDHAHRSRIASVFKQFSSYLGESTRSLRAVAVSAFGRKRSFTLKQTQSPMRHPQPDRKIAVWRKLGRNRL